jgi:hypothetical protein
MSRVEIPFTGPTYKSESLILSPQECINLYLRPYPDVSGDKLALMGTPGMVEFSDLETGAAVQALLVLNEYLYAVSGGTLFRVNQAGAVEALGVISHTGPVDMATNGLDIIIVTGDYGFIWDLETGFAQITDLDFPGGDTVVYADGYYLVNRPRTGQIWRSDYNTGMSWGGLAFSTAGGDSDNVIALQADHKDIVVLGDWTTEIWYNTGEETFNFARIDGAFLEQGIVSAFAKTKINNAVYFLGQDKSGRGHVFQLLGRGLKVVSDTPIEYLISKQNFNDARMFSYQQTGHSHVVLTFPLSDLTLVYDSTTGYWHQRSSRISGVDRRWRANCHAFFVGYNIVGDFINGKLYRLDPEAYDEDGEDMVAVRTSAVVRKNQSPITVDEVQIFTEPGVGAESGDAEDIEPVMMLSWSKDGGRTWSAEVGIPMGAIGETENRSRYTQLGQGRNWVFRTRISAAVKRVILGAYAEVEVDE